MKVTVKDIAKASKVSVGTVSGVIRNKGNIKPETRQRVLEAMQKLNYIPYNNAQLVRRQETQTIGLVVPMVSYEKSSLLARAIFNFQEILDESGYTCIIYTQKEIERRVSGPSDHGIIAGALVAFSCYSTLINTCLGRLAEGGMPVVLVRRQGELAGVPEILDDGYSAVTEMLDHIHAAGHRRMVYVNYEDNPYIEDRVNAFRQFHQDKGLPLKPEQIITYRESEPDENVQTALRLKCSAMVCADDAIALDMMRMLQGHGIRVPDQIAVTGFNNSSACEMVNPRLTSVEIPIDQMMHLAVRTIEDIRKRIRPEKATTTFKDELVIRESSGAGVK